MERRDTNSLSFTPLSCVLLPYVAHVSAESNGLNPIKQDVTGLRTDRFFSWRITIRQKTLSN
jgi:hypothetical protein